MARLQQYPLRFEPEERAAWQAAADKAGIPLSQWIRTACNAAANHPREQELPSPQHRSEYKAQTQGTYQAQAVASPTWEQVCPHPRHERTTYGVCRACKQQVGQ